MQWCNDRPFYPRYAMCGGGGGGGTLGGGGIFLSFRSYFTEKVPYWCISLSNLTFGRCKKIFGVPPLYLCNFGCDRYFLKQ